MRSQWIIYLHEQFGETMFDDQWDPYQTLKNHDEWIRKIAEHMEQLAQGSAAMARTIERQNKMIRHLGRAVEHQQQLILDLDQRIKQLEKQ